MDTQQEETRYRLQLFGRRIGRRLRPAKASLLTDLLPRLSFDADQVRSPHCLFDPPKRHLWLEIGSGSGEHLVRRARDHSDVGLIGAEIFINGLAATLADLSADPVDNVRLWTADARELLDLLPAESIGRCFILFPDPWPKWRHRGRRFVQASTVTQLARVMADGAQLLIASDHGSLVAWMIEHLAGHSAFSWRARRADDWRQPPSDWIETRYQLKARVQGRQTIYLDFVRKPRHNNRNGRHLGE